MKHSPSPELLRKLLLYSPHDGKLFWLPRTPDMFVSGRQSAGQSCAKWNAQNAFKEAFTTVDAAGYLQGSIFDRAYRAHRVIWAMVTGEWPDGMIDHENRNRSDNRFKNLRPASASQNMHNRGMSKNNSSGFKGVSWDSSKSKWHAQIGLNRKTHHLGYFDCLNEAHNAYAEASQAMHGAFGYNGRNKK